MIVNEIVGVAGSGKSLLSARLNAADPRVKAGVHAWRLPKGRLALSGALSLPDLVRHGMERRAFPRMEFKDIVRLDAFYRMLRSDAKSPEVVFIDEGAVFTLAKLRVDLGPTVFRGALGSWEKKVMNRWSAKLDTIVWLDASDEVLIPRIRRRPKRHRMKSKSDRTIREFLNNYRAAYKAVIDGLVAHRRIKLLKFQTDDADPALMAAEVLAACSLRQHSLTAKVS